MPPLIHQNVRTFIVSGTQTRDPTDAEAAAIRPILEEKVRLDGHIRSGRRYIAGVGFVHWRQVTAFEQGISPTPGAESGRYLALYVGANAFLEEVLWMGVFPGPEAAIAAFEDRVTENLHTWKYPGTVFVIDRMDGRVLRSTGKEPPYSDRAAEWLRMAEDELRSKGNSPSASNAPAAGTHSRPDAAKAPPSASASAAAPSAAGDTAAPPPSKRSRRRQREAPSPPTIPDALLREAAAYAAEHGEPLLHRLCAPAEKELVILAIKWDRNYFHLSTEATEAQEAPRHAHFEMLYDQGDLDDEDDDLPRALGDSLDHEYVRELLSSRRKQKRLELAQRRYALRYGGPAVGTIEELRAWLDEPIDLASLSGDWERNVSIARSECEAYQTLLRVLELFGVRPTWYHPDTGEEIGDIGDIASMVSDGTQEVTSAAALTCLQWSFDLLGVSARIEVREPGRSA